ncbi:MAG: FtsX-like permease family protein [Pseudomonadales bacterium]
MSRRLGLQLALRYAFGRARSLSAIGALATAGLALSVAVLVIVISVVNGFERELQDRVLGLLPHVTIASRSPVKPTEEVQDFLRVHPEVVDVVSFVQSAALVAVDAELSAVMLSGIDVGQPAAIARLQPYFSGDLAAELAPGAFAMVLGAAVAADLGVQAGDSVMLVLPQASVSIAGLIPRQKRMRVAGVINSRSELDSRSAYVNQQDAQRLFRLGGRIHGYHLTLRDLFAADQVAAQLGAQLGGDGYLARSWFRSHGNLYQAIVIQKQTMFILLSFLIAVAAFNLVSSLLMVGKQRSGDIAILSTLGAPRATFNIAFALLGVFVGGIGIVAGLLGGVLVSWALPPLYQFISDQFELSLMAEYFVNYLPVDVRLGDLLGISAVAVSLALLSALYPAWRLAKMRPSEVLAHE